MCSVTDGCASVILRFRDEGVSKQQNYTIDSKSHLKPFSRNNVCISECHFLTSGLYLQIQSKSRHGMLFWCCVTAASQIRRKILNQTNSINITSRPASRRWKVCLSAIWHDLTSDDTPYVRKTGNDGNNNTKWWGIEVCVCARVCERLCGRLEHVSQRHTDICGIIYSRQILSEARGRLIVKN